MKKRIILASIGLIFQIIQFFKNKSKIISKTHLLNIVKELNPLSPTQLIKNIDKLQDYGLCIGNAFASEKCSSILFPKRRVIVSKLYQMKTFTIRQQFHNLKKLLRTKFPSYFTLNDSFSSIPILQTQNLAMKTTHTLHKYNDVNNKSQLNFIISLINIVKDINIPYVTDFRIQEKYLPEGTKIAVLGKFKKQGIEAGASIGKISCQKPIAMGLSKNSIIQRLHSKISTLKIQKYCLIFGIAFCLGFLIKEIYKHYANQKKKKQDPIQNIQKLYVKSRVCFNCRQKLSNFVLQNCGHLTMCKQCKEKLKICGQCKKAGEKGIQLYAC